MQVFRNQSHQQLAPHCYTDSERHLLFTVVVRFFGNESDERRAVAFDTNRRQSVSLSLTTVAATTLSPF